MKPPDDSSGSLFPVGPELPRGFIYQANFLSEQEEANLLDGIRGLPFLEFDFHGYTAKRRVVEYGLQYDFSTNKTSTTQSFPDFLLPIRERAAQFAEVKPESLVEGIVLEYPPGAPIGWHRDAPQFGTVVGISLLSAARMRLKPYIAGKQKSAARLKPASILLEPRSIYVISGPARWRFQHSIPPVTALRYSITFRTLRSGSKGSEVA
jgi:alkylated DNA repair dioxygenase AlkB